MADGSGLWAIVIMVLVVLASLYIFFEVLGFQPVGSTAAH